MGCVRRLAKHHTYCFSVEGFEGREMLERCHPSHSWRGTGMAVTFGSPTVIYIDVPPLGELLIPLEEISLRNMPLGREHAPRYYMTA